MTLPFVPDNNKRMYVCFCCGMEFVIYEEYKNHILKEHEEGKDYVRCPLKRCGAPVRDLLLHHRVKHKNEPIPKGRQMKALVWRDIKATKKKQKKPKYKEGYYPSKKMGKEFKFRSGYEESVFQCLDYWSEVTAFEAEPFKIPYLFEGEAHNYTPDILIQFVDGHKELWEIKPAGQTSLPINQAKWFAAQRACEARGWQWKVIKERDIKALKKLVSRRNVSESNQLP